MQPSQAVADRSLRYGENSARGIQFRRQALQQFAEFRTQAGQIAPQPRRQAHGFKPRQPGQGDRGIGTGRQRRIEIDIERAVARLRPQQCRHGLVAFGAGGVAADIDGRRQEHGFGIRPRRAGRRHAQAATRQALEEARQPRIDRFQRYAVTERTTGKTLDVAQANHGGAQAGAVESFERRHHPGFRLAHAEPAQRLRRQQHDEVGDFEMGAGGNRRPVQGEVLFAARQRDDRRGQLLVAAAGRNIEAENAVEPLAELRAVQAGFLRRRHGSGRRRRRWNRHRRSGRGRSPPGRHRAV